MIATTPGGNVPFLILTRAGFDDLVQRVDHAGAVLVLNPDLATEAELARLREAGAIVHVLPNAVDPASDEAAQLALRGIGGATGRAWVEHGGSEPGPATAPVPPEQLSGERSRSLHRRLADTAGTVASHAWRRLRHMGSGGNLMLLPYLGFGNAGKLWVKGRVLNEVDFREQSGHDSSWRNLIALYRRLESDEVAGARVVARFQGQVLEAETDRGGYFSFEINPSERLPGGWHEVELALPDGRHGAAVQAVAQVKVPSATARFGIISDIDDTVLWTNVTNKLNMALMLARSNAHTRKPFKGVAAFYRALSDGCTGNEDNPMFYVSSSPWHLFGPLVDFLRMQDIPLGPLLLRELSMREVFKLSSHGNHKLGKIELILSFYPDMQFVLIGDSGEQDPEIYAEVVRRHPQAVRMIYIRNVNPDPSRIDALDRLIQEVSATGIQLVLAPDSVFAASHAAAEGLIHVDRLADVRQDKRDDDKLLSAG